LHNAARRRVTNCASILVFRDRSLPYKESDNNFITQYSFFTTTSRTSFLELLKLGHLLFELGKRRVFQFSRLVKVENTLALVDFELDLRNIQL
jgi:hypothetical protein